MTFTLPALQTREGPELEFKSEPSIGNNGKANHLELAKDMAAMANAYGGAIIVGACENPKGILSFYRTMSKERAGEVCDQYSMAYRDRLRPAPIVVPEAIEHDKQFIVVVRVEASVGQAVGVRFVPREEIDQNESKAPPEIYGFPVRVGDNTVWLQPEQLPVLMLPELRRTILLLHRIGTDNVKIDTMRRQITDAGTANYSITKVDPELNVVSLSDNFSIPIDRIRSIYRRGNDWHIAYESIF